MPTKRIKMPKRPKAIVVPKGKKPAKPKRKPFLRRVRAAIIGKTKGGTVGTQEKQLRELGLMDDEEFRRLK